jgi:DNA polymerase-3 subunit epsilon
MGMNDFIQFFKGMSAKAGSHIYTGINGQSDPQHISFLRKLQKDLKEKNSLEAPLHTLKVVVFDIETTGFFPEKGDKVISIGAVKMCGTKIESGESSSFYSLIKTDQSLSGEISALTSITDEDLAAAPNASDVLLDFYRFSQDRILVAHHSNHERAFMKKMSWDALGIRFEHRLIDTSFLIRLSSPKAKSEPQSLEELCLQCGIEIRNRHFALADAQMAAQIWGYYLNQAQAMGMSNLQDVYEQLSKIS